MANRRVRVHNSDELKNDEWNNDNDDGFKGISISVSNVCQLSCNSKIKHKVMRKLYWTFIMKNFQLELKEKINSDTDF